MHELSLVEGVLKVVESEREKNGFRRVLEIRLALGEYSGVETECFCGFFPYAAKNTCAENAELVFEPVPASFRCRECGTVGSADRKNMCCASCGSLSLKMVTGREFQIRSLKVE